MRLFLALELPDDLRLALIDFIDAARRSVADASVRWVPGANLHVTLVFLGEQPPERVPEVLVAARRVAATCPPLDLVLEGSGRFPAPRRSRRRSNPAAWVGVSGDTQGLAALAERLRHELGLEPDRRPYHPHVTVARIGADDPGVTLPPIGELGRWRAEGVVLFESRQMDGELRYLALGRAPLGDQRASPG